MKKLLFALLSLLLTFPALSQDRLTGKTFTTRSEILARNGMAATSQPMATQTALDILKKKGSAMDAAIAANAVLGLVEPASCGIGGDLFAIVWDAKLYIKVTRPESGIPGAADTKYSLRFPKIY